MNRFLPRARASIHQARRQRFQRAVRMHQRIGGGHHLELVRRGDERQAGEARQFGRDFLGVAFRCVQAGAHRGAAQRQFAQVRQRAMQVPVGLLQLRDVAGELLAQRERRGVLQMRAADLHDVHEVG
jgi:hypothetical protein